VKAGGGVSGVDDAEAVTAAAGEAKVAHCVAFGADKGGEAGGCLGVGGRAGGRASFHVVSPVIERAFDGVRCLFLF
jgi:hypothetical protein